MATTNTYDIRINSTQAEQALTKLQDSLGKTTDNFAKLRNAFAGLAIGGFIANAYSAANALTDMAAATGISTQSLLGFQKAVAANGGTFDGAVSAVGKFVQAIDGAAGGSKELQDVFLKLGISLDELGTLSEQDLLRRTVLGFENLRKGGETTAASVKLFGKEFRAVDLQAVAGQLDAVTAKMYGTAKAVEAAGETSQNLSNAQGTLKTSLLAALQPISELANVILQNKGAVEAFIKTIVNLGIALGSILVVSKVLTPLANMAMLASSTGQSFGKLAGAAIGLTGSISKAKEGMYLAGAALQAMTFGAGNLAGWMTKLGAIFGALAGAFVRFLPIIGQIVSALLILNGVVEMITGSSLVDWAEKAAKSLGLISQTSKEQEAAAATAKEHAEAEKAKAERLREVQAALQKELDALNQLVKAYKTQNDEANKKFGLETDSIRMSERQKMLKEQLLEAEIKYNQEATKLQQQLEEKRKSGSESDKNSIKQIEVAQNELKKAYDEQVGSIEKLVSARISETNANQLNLFSIQSLIDNTNKLKDIQLEIANTGLPTLIQEYNKLEAAAQRSAESAIAAEEARRKEKLNPEEVAAYYAAAFQGVDKLKKATEELTRVQQAYNLEKFGIKERIQLENDLQKILDERSKLTMNELQRKEYDLVTAAKARAKAEIEAEEARRGSRLNPAEAQAYYDAALKGSQELLDAQRALYQESRTFGTGWKKALGEFSDEANNAAKQAERIFQKVTSSMEDMIINFAKTGKFEFKGFMNSILEELLRSQVRQLMAQIFNLGGSRGSGGGGGLLGAFGNLLGFANGGIIPTNAPVLVGERGPEIISGAAGRNVTPNNQIGMGTTQVVYNINAVDAMSFKQMVAADPAFIYAVTQQGAKSVPQTRR